MALFNVADILIPQSTDMTKWSVVACDQYTSEPQYWEDVKSITDGCPSAYNIIFPEVYLGKDDEKRIAQINSTMRSYLDSGIFREIKDALIYVERTQTDGKTRQGIIGQIDLEQYDFTKGSQPKIRATEGTIIERIPPRVRIRRGAPLEMPHIIMLADDRKKTVIEPLKDKTARFEKLYDFDLMKNSGHIRGWLLDNNAKNEVLSAFSDLEDKAAFDEKYGVSGKDILVLAAGDGNHSLATAKSCWDEIKETLSEEERLSHPARFALVEVMNIHDDALVFEPIQRVLFGVDPERVLDAMKEFYEISENGGSQRVDYVYKGLEGTLYIKNPKSNLPVGSLQIFLDKYLAENGGSIDYIHGNDVVRSLSDADGAIGFMVAPMEKNDLFTSVIKDGSLPRKTFSMGEAADKRFYLECKRIR